MTESRHTLSVQSSVQSSLQLSESSHESTESKSEVNESSESESEVNESPDFTPFTSAFADFLGDTPVRSAPAFGSNPTPAPAAAPSSVPSAIRAVRVGFLGGEGKRGRKYILSGRVNGQLFHQLVDSAADISVVPRHMVKRFNLTTINISYRLDVSRYDEDVRT